MTINNSKKAFYLLKRLFSFHVEEFWACFLASDATLLSADKISQGSVDFCLAHPRDIFRLASSYNASFIILAHNHPTGSTQPSQSDLAVTKKILACSRFMEIPIVDHIILSRTQYYSFADSYLIKESHRSGVFYANY